jgi:hypothetical protein
MPTEPTAAGPEVLSLIPDEYLAAMGQVCAAWAMLDFRLDMAICQLAQSPQFLGVCVTSQIFSTPNKLNALGGLMRAHGISEKRISWLNTFQQKTHELGRKRNRAVHDAIMFGLNTQTVYRMSATITPRKSVAFGVTPSSSEELMETFQEINSHVSRFLEFWSETSAEFVTLRRKVPLGYFEFFPPAPRQEREPISADKSRPRRGS